MALRRPVSVIMLSISMLALGGIAWSRMPLKFLPDVDRPFIGVTIPYPNSSPQQVEQQIAIPLEGEMRTVPGLRRIRTISDADGCFASLQFSLDTNITQVTAEVRDRIERLKLKLPSEADNILLQRFSSRSIPVIAFGVFREGDPEQFIHEIRTFMEPRIRRLDGVANVEIITPIEENEILIEFDQETLQSLNLGIAQVVGVLAESSLNVSVGELTDSGRKYFVRAEGEYRRVEDIENLVVTPNGMRLNEVARVRYSNRDPAAHVALDGKSGAVLLVVKESEANTVDVCRRVNAEVAAITTSPMFSDITLQMFFDQSVLILSALSNLFKQGLYGGALAICVLLFFLHRLRPTLVVAFSIPTSLLLTFVFMFFMDMSLNLVTMVSMIIAVGMLVDNGIVVVENIIRRRQLGESPTESALRGTNEVGIAVAGSTATTIVVFLPMFYLETGRMSVFMEQLGLPLIVSLLGSLLIALTLVPLVLSRMKDTGHANVFEKILEHREDALAKEGGRMAPLLIFLSKYEPVRLAERFFGATTNAALRNRLATVLVVVAIGLLTYYIPFQSVGMRELPELDTREIKIDVKLDQNYDMKMAADLFHVLEAELNTMRDELGIRNMMTFYERGGGVLDVYLYNPDDDHPYALNPPFVTEDVMKILAQRLPERVPGARLDFTITDTSESGSEAVVSLRMEGDDTKMLDDFAQSFSKVVSAAVPNVRDVKVDTEDKEDEIRLHVDEPLSKQRGVTSETLAVTVQTALRGSRLPFMKQGSREIPVWAQYREEDRQSRANLENVKVLSATGELVAANELLEFVRAPSTTMIQRVDGKNVVNLSANADSSDLGQIKRDLQNVADQFELPTGYRIQLGDSLVELDENIFSFASTLLMAVILIYIVMGSLFESYLYPLSILTTVPLALAGAVWMLYFTNTPFDSVTLIGCILMAGIIVNNGIVIVDYINTLRARGHDRDESIVMASTHRFRPVMMTALTTILGLVPLALATTGGAATFAGLGRALIGGLTVGTFLTLVVVPVMYTFLDDLQSWSINYLGNLRDKGKVVRAPRLP